jgi:hypothetical protein
MSIYRLTIEKSGRESQVYYLVPSGEELKAYSANPKLKKLEDITSSFGNSTQGFSLIDSGKVNFQKLQPNEEECIRDLISSLETTAAQ